MSLLLDTHVFLWWCADNPSLSVGACQAINEGEQDVFVSAATVWEITIKQSLGKLKAPANLTEVLVTNDFLALPISIEHAVSAGELPAHHRDPFDRMLIAQARLEGLTLVTRDANIGKYDVPILRA